MSTHDKEQVRVRVAIRGAVQGVGFRPFVYRLAAGLGLAGWVSNSSQGVFIEAEGRRPQVQDFLFRLEKEKPPRAFIQSLDASFLDPIGYATFEIHHSDDSGEKSALVLPDIATCSDCLREIFDPHNRRHLYPFTNCTNCGPRFSIITALPYDRANTTMKGFAMCAQCQAEYDDPADRRFHAQPNACPACGPQLALWDREGLPLANKQEALFETADAILRGKIVAVKGLGGFHLMADARNEAAVRKLRERKRREEKPFALMYPSLESIKADCRVSALEERLLHSPEAPIVLLRRRFSSRNPRISNPPSAIASSVAPRNPYLGVMLPYTPLHHLLMKELRMPVVATSGNLSDEPICTEEQEALVRLNGIADVFLVHNRPIGRHLDDSIVRVMMGRELVIRRARGYAPLPLPLKQTLPPLLAVGAHLKNTIALAVDKQIFVSQHIGDLETAQAFSAFQKVIGDFERLYGVHPEMIACDDHPEYLATKFARKQGAPPIGVQHHFAHVAACMAENELEGPALGVAWDGTGYGLDGTIWGGEFLLTTEHSFRRIAHWRTFRLPGGEKAIKEPRRAALGLLHEILGEAVFALNDLAPIQAFSADELQILRTMLKNNLNAPLTSSAGRLFDAVAAMLNLRQKSAFEGQAAMALEFARHGTHTDDYYPIKFLHGKNSQSPGVVDWQPMLQAIFDDWRRDIPTGMISAKFHNALVEAIIAVARHAGEKRVVLTGGCFQNKYLTERTIIRLKNEGFRPYWHQRIPPNDGGIALGQIVAAARRIAQRA